MRRRLFPVYRSWQNYLYIIALIGLSACSPLKNIESNPGQPAPLLLTDHELIDTIWDVHGWHKIDKSQLPTRISEADYVLLGELHDNIVHHRKQAWIVDNMAERNRTGSVAFEMIDNRQGDLITKEDCVSSAALIDKLDYYPSTWQYETYYQVVFDSTIRAGYKIYPANLDRHTLMKTLMQDKKNLSDQTRHILSQTRLTPKHYAELQDDIIRSHCGMLDSDTVDSMVEMQRIRDATMAVSLLKSKADLKVLIAGVGHVRKDRGVPLYLYEEEKDISVISIALLEVEEDHNDLAAYAMHWEGGHLPFDYVWFTARAERPNDEDYCIKLKERFKDK